MPTDALRSPCRRLPPVFCNGTTAATATPRTWCSAAWGLARRRRAASRCWARWRRHCRRPPTSCTPPRWRRPRCCRPPLPPPCCRSSSSRSNSRARRTAAAPAGHCWGRRPPRGARASRAPPRFCCRCGGPFLFTRCRPVLGAHTTRSHNSPRTVHMMPAGAGRRLHRPLPRRPQQLALCPSRCPPHQRRAAQRQRRPQQRASPPAAGQAAKVRGGAHGRFRRLLHQSPGPGWG